MILKSQDTELMADIWLRASIEAHDFIESSFWTDNYPAMRDVYLPSSENYACIDENGVMKGFVSLSGNHIHALFVDVRFQGQGIGTRLLDFVKKQKRTLTLAVYERNEKSVGFYAASGFETTGRGIEQNTGQPEIYMEWQS